MEKKKILVIDDKPSISFILQEYLTDLGYEVITDNSHKSALNRLGSVDLVVSDVDVDEVKSGLAFVEKARKEVKYCNPIILISGRGYKNEANLMGCEYIGKPFKFEVLESLINKSLNVKSNE